jgi:dihydrofolate reductase
MISLIAAVSENNCIGKKNALPWYLPEDLKHFKQITSGYTVLMGRKTWESIPAKFRPLPNRKNIVITAQMDFSVPNDVEVYHTISEALEAHKNEQIFIIGGGNIYIQTINLADTLYITHVHQTVDGDVFFPKIDKAVWREIERENFEKFSFVKYTKLCSS